MFVRIKYDGRVAELLSRDAEAIAGEQNTIVLLDGALHLLGEEIVTSLDDVSQIILELFQSGGIHAVCHRVAGQFAMIIMSGLQVYLISDLFRTVPLFWSYDGASGFDSVITVATIQSAVVDDRLRRSMNCSINRKFIASWIVGGFTPIMYRSSLKTATPIVEVSSLPGSHRLHIDMSKGEALLQRYWLPGGTLPHVGEKSTALDTIDRVLGKAVQRCFMYGKVAISLSSGLDSTTMAYYAAKVDKTTLCYTKRYAGWEETDEYQLAQQNAHRLGLASLLVDTANDRPFSRISSDFIFRYGIEHNWLHETMVHAADVVHNHGASVIIGGLGAEQVFGVGFSPVYLRYLVRRGDFPSFLKHTAGWMRRLGESPLNVWKRAISPNRVTHNPENFDWNFHTPNWLLVPTSLTESIEDPGAMLPGEVSGRAQALCIDDPLMGGISDYNSVYSARGMKLLHPFLSREVIEASFCIPQHILQDPQEFKGILYDLGRRNMPSVKFGPTGGLGPFISDSLDKEACRLLSFFEDSPTLVDLQVVDEGITTFMRHFFRDLTDGDRNLKIFRTACNTIQAEMWLRGFKEYLSDRREI